MQLSDLLNNTLSTAGVISPGQTPSTIDYTLAQNFLNNLIGSWNSAVLKALNATFSPSLFTFNAVAATVNLTDVLSLPAGWPRALMYNAALDVLHSYKRVPDPALVQLAEQSKAEIVTPAGTPAPTA